jgi:hypothetical protein
LEETIKTRILPASTASSLNDPFDLQPSYVDDVSAKFLEDLSPRLLERLQGQDVVIRPEDIRTTAEAAKLRLVELRAETKIISFSARLDSTLLWSHYANGYRGACLFFLKKLDRMGAFSEASRVFYSSQRPIYPLSLIAAIESERRASYMSERLRRLNVISNSILHLTKAPDWSYEAEIRIVVPSYIKKDLIFDHEELHGIVVGPLCSSVDLDRIKTIKAAYLPTLRIFKSSISTSAFSVDVDWQNAVA